MTKREKIYLKHINWCKRFNKLGVGYSAKSYPPPDKDGKIRFRKGVLKINRGEYPIFDGLFMPLGSCLNPMMWKESDITTPAAGTPVTITITKDNHA